MSKNSRSNDGGMGYLAILVLIGTGDTAVSSVLLVSIMRLVKMMMY